MGSLNNPDGTKSSRRLLGAISILAGLGLIIAGFAIDRYPPFDLLLLVIGSGFSLLGITTFDQYFKNLKP